MPGSYLATITSEEEQKFVLDLLQNSVEGGEWWLGGFQGTEPEVDPAEGWAWVTGEPWVYVNWGNGEPNDYYDSGEDYLGINVPYGDWNDEAFLGNIHGYIAEIGTPPQFDERYALQSGDGTESCLLGPRLGGAPCSVVLINPNPSWESNNPNGRGAAWISFGDTGTPGSESPPSSRTEPIMTISERFEAKIGDRLAIDIWADDTAEVFLDGASIFKANFSQDICAAGPIGCEPGENGRIEYVFEETGEHTLSFDVYQVGGGPFGLMYSGAVFGHRGPQVDVKPWSESNVVDPRSPSLLTVAVFSDMDFDALQVDLQSLRLGPGDARARNYRVYDLNRDRIPDLLAYFRLRDLRVGCGETALELTGRTYAGSEFAGRDEVTNRQCAGTQPSRITVSALIDGRSQLILRGSTAQWHHLDFAAPGTHMGADLPIVINGAAWYPEWPDEGENYFCNCYSNKFSGVAPPVPNSAVPVNLQVLQGRGAVRIIQTPKSTNGYALVVEFDDNTQGGSADYVIELTLGR
jgi:hypothetical protein